MHLVEREELKVLHSYSSDDGIKNLYTQWQQVKALRENFFLAFLQKKIYESLPSLPVGSPILISGMASSSIGLKTLPYATLPFSCSGKDLHIERISTELFRSPVFLISGVSSGTDVIRGEETQMIGLYDALYDKSKVIYILPGTHSKHVICDQGKVTQFATFMTGELFDVIRGHTVLKNSVGRGKWDKSAEQKYCRGVLDSQSSKLLHHLFRIRAADVLNKQSQTDSYYYLSGLLIGQELMNARLYRADKILIGGVEPLSKLYMLAAKVHKIKAERIEKEDVQTAVVKGHATILKTLNVDV